MDASPVAMGNLARQWDEQHLDLDAAAGQIGGAPTGGFSPGVSGAASRFSTTWQRFTSDLGEVAEQRADGIRTTANELFQTDRTVGVQHQVLQSVLREVR